jgi:glycosyltransferase involved in cell wall biosynthesis
MKILSFSTLYPNCEMPRHGIFVERRLSHLLESGEVEARVVAPVPWFPFKSKLFRTYGRYARIPEMETRHNLTVEHPRYLSIPKIGMNLTPGLMARAAAGTIRRLINRGYDFDLIDAHYFYPDGVAAAKLANLFRKPLVITARGTDLNLIPQFKKPRAMILGAAQRADGIVTVCQALKQVLVELGVASEKIRVLRNGVDLKAFSPPIDRPALRERLEFTGISLLSVGHLIDRKGHDLVIKALAHLPDARLLIAGDGEELEALKKLARNESVQDRVTFLGAVSPDQLKDYYGAADVLVLASSREGWANVLLESMACGTPVVATNIWGTPEVVRRPEAGVLVERSANSIAQGIKSLLEQNIQREDTRRYAEQFSWDETTRGQLALFNDILGKWRQ